MTTNEKIAEALELLKDVQGSSCVGQAWHDSFKSFVQATRDAIRHAKGGTDVDVYTGDDSRVSSDTGGDSGLSDDESKTGMHEPIREPVASQFDTPEIVSEALELLDAVSASLEGNELGWQESAITKLQSIGKQDNSNITTGDMRPNQGAPDGELLTFKEQPDTPAPTLERLAEAQHVIWSAWMRHMFKDGGKLSQNGMWIMSYERYDRWQRQMLTPYNQLSEHERESDRKVIREHMPFLLAEQEADDQERTIIESVTLKGADDEAR